MKNKLAKEQSPYLLQHANNPVNWFPWCNEAFEKAKEEDKPIFLSIGYSACHWCHVMAHESFEDVQVAELLNKNFISIKVDREERPDIDNIYMTTCQIITGRGGWPLSIFMTPEKKPFYAGTYFPKYSYAGRIGFVDLLNRIINLWQFNRDELRRSSEEITNYLKAQHSFKLTPFDKSNESLNPDIFKKVYHSLKNNYDSVYGGFGGAPKFPTSHNLIFLLNYYLKYKDLDALNMSLKTLEEMRNGGMYDQIGFGFHRYSTDRKWLLPHFEKMLYDQAALIETYSLAFKITKDKFFKSVALEIFDYLNREMLSEEGGFYSSQDADSEGEEGKFYTWETSEIKDIVQDKYEIVKTIFNLSDEGNYLQEATRKLTGRNILYISKRIDKLIEELNLQFDLSFRVDEYENLRKLLLNHRNKRIHPLKDDKILTDWNSLTISSLAKSSLMIGNSELLKTAINCYNFLLNNSANLESNKLYHTYKNKRTLVEGFLDDYAFFIQASLDLYRATFDEKYLLNAVNFNSTLLAEFWDYDNGGFYFTSKNNLDNIVRTKDAYDGAIASGNSVQLSNLFRLYKLTADSNLLEIINKQIKAFVYQINNALLGFTHFLNVLLTNQWITSISSDMSLEQDSYELIIVANENYDLNQINQLSQYDNINCILVTSSNKDKIAKIADWINNYKLLNNKTTYYLCRNFTCNIPTNDFNEILKIIS